VAYAIQFKPVALRQLEKLPHDVQKRIAGRIEALQDAPLHSGCAKLSGELNTWRLRVGNYRVIYQVHARVLLVLVLNVGHRREVYRYVWSEPRHLASDSC
jgi:mRNA interferase RelE/StbE